MMTALELELAEEALTQGLAYWQAFQAKKAQGILTRADLDVAKGKLDVDVDELVAARAAQKARLAGTEPV